MAFHFPLMPRLFMALRMEDRFPIIDILEQTPADPGELPVGALPAQPRRADARDGDRRGARLHVPRLRAATRRRGSTSASAAGSRRCSATTAARIELMNGLLFSLPGTPVIYYGDEIGMGDNIYLGDRNGVRTPMQWSADRNAGFSRANPQRLYLPVIIDPEYHYEAVNVEAQQDNPHSLLWWMKRLIALRKRSPALRPRHARVPVPREPQGARVRPPATRTSASSSSPTSRASSQYAELDLSRVPRAACRSSCSGGTAFPRDRRAAVLPHARPARLLLVPARAADGRARDRRPRDGRRRSRSRAPGRTCSPSGTAGRSRTPSPASCARRGGSVPRRAGSSPSRSPTRSPWRRTEPSSPASSRSSRSSSPRAIPRPTSCRSRARPSSTRRSSSSGARARSSPGCERATASGPSTTRSSSPSCRPRCSRPSAAAGGSARTACGSRRIRPRPSAASRARRPTSRTRGRCRPSRATPRSCSATGWC